MEKLSNEEMEKIFGGGWVKVGNDWYYVPDGDDEDNDDDIIFI